MRCEHAREQLELLRYEGGPLDADTAAHVAGCAECEAFASRGDALDQVLALDDAAPARPGFDTRFFARLDEERRVSKRRGMWRWAWTMVPVGVGAALVLMGGPGVAPHEQQEQPPPGFTQLTVAGDGADLVPDLMQGETSGDDVALLMDLELLEELPVLQRLDELEAFELLEGLDEDELDVIIEERQQ